MQNKIIKLAIIIGILIISFSVFYYLVIFPNQNKYDLEKCLFDAQMIYDEQWKERCLALGEAIGEDGFCQTLPSEIAYWIREEHFQLLDKCFRQYPR
ncbi:hypothetical protein KJ756_03105 [Patescibacteria group bacterium]|nr:hypothetical protein [Patescibacteria group bacterium]MBU4082935.1 hypothetical protein [Patescibacteria group bacterium]